MLSAALNTYAFFKFLLNICVDNHNAQTDLLKAWCSNFYNYRNIKLYIYYIQIKTILVNNHVLSY